MNEKISPILRNLQDIHQRASDYYWNEMAGLRLWQMAAGEVHAAAAERIDQAVASAMDRLEFVAVNPLVATEIVARKATKEATKLAHAPKQFVDWVQDDPLRAARVALTGLGVGAVIMACAPLQAPLPDGRGTPGSSIGPTPTAELVSSPTAIMIEPTSTPIMAPPTETAIPPDAWAEYPANPPPHGGIDPAIDAKYLSARTEAYADVAATTARYLNIKLSALSPDAQEFLGENGWQAILVVKPAPGPETTSPLPAGFQFYMYPAQQGEGYKILPLTCQSLLSWKFDGNGKPTWEDKAGNIFGEFKDGQTDTYGYAVVTSELGLPLDKVSFTKDKPLLVRNVFVNASGNPVSLEVQVSPGNWQTVSDKFASRVQLNDQAKKDAKLYVPPPTIRPPSTATATKAPPTETPKPTVDILRPAPVTDFYTYGGIKNFALPEAGGISWTKDIATQPHTMGFKTEPGSVLGLLSNFSYYTFPDGINSYDLWRLGKPPGGKVYTVPGYFFEVNKVEWVDQVKGLFIIKSQVVNAAGITVNLEITLADNPIYDHIRPSDVMWGKTFYQIKDQKDTPAKANPGLIRNRKSATEVDVVGIGGSSAANSEWLKGQIDAATVPGQVVSVSGAGNPNVWLMLITE